MRVLLDAHISPKRVATALRAAGHDARALDEEPALAGLDDQLVLELAATDKRVLVTFNVKDYVPLLRQWAEGEREHAGWVLVHGLAHEDFGPLLRGLAKIFEAYPSQREWVNLTLALPLR